VLLFYTKVAQAFAQAGWLDLHFLKLNERRIAFQYAVSYQGKAFSLKPGYDPKYAEYSPSSLLLLLYLERAFQEAKREYDLLGTEEEWKLMWAQHTRAHYWLFIFSNALLPSLLYRIKFQLVPALQRYKPYERLRQTAVSLRRRLGWKGAHL
jgi:CelD/BcsL family acetyltransferase involved in cellulose biosynthesis